MSSHQEQDMNIDGVSEKDVVEFLQKHPNFFEKHLNLLAELRLPHPTGNAVSLIERQVNVDELVSLAIIASLIQGEYLAAAVVSFVMVAGALIEEATSDSARKAIESLVSLSPDMATKIVNGDTVEVSITDVLG